MRSLFLFFGIVIILSSCNKDTTVGYENIELEDYIIDNYSTDAKQLYIHEIYSDSTHPEYYNTEIDYDEVEKMLKIIQAVYNSESPWRDTVFDVYNIHAFYCYSLNSMYLQVDTSLPEIQNLSNNIIPTGEANLDAILNNYNFDSVKTFYSYPDFNWLSIFTKDEYNLLAVENEFENLQSISIAEVGGGCVGDGNQITIERNESSAIIVFSIGWGDCPAGCIHHRYWEFKVENGQAEFIETYNN